MPWLWVLAASLVSSTSDLTAPSEGAEARSGGMDLLWVQRGADRIGRVYRKALCREYTDATFTMRELRRSVRQQQPDGVGERLRLRQRPAPVFRMGGRVRWYVMSTTNFELHAPHWHGNVVVAQHLRTDVPNLGTMGMIVADMTPDDSGTWLFHCHVEPQMTAGMQMRFRVEPALPTTR